MKRQVIRGMKIPEPINQPKPPELPLSHKTLVQWEANVDKNKFEYSYIYNFNEEKQCADIVIKFALGVTIEFTYGRTFPYKLFLNNKEVFVTDTLRDIAKWLEHN